MCEWLAEQHQGRWATLVDLAQSVPTFLVFREPGAGIPHDLHEAMDSLCRLVRETPPRTYHLFRIHHPVVLLHWRVQAHLVSRLSPELHRAYRQLFAAETINERLLSTYGLRGMVDPPDPSPTVRVVLVDHLCHPAASIAADVSPPGSPLDQADYPPEEDEASFPMDARHAEEVPVQDPSERSIVSWERLRPGAGASYDPILSTLVPLPEP